MALSTIEEAVRGTRGEKGTRRLRPALDECLQDAARSKFIEHNADITRALPARTYLRVTRRVAEYDSQRLEDYAIESGGQAGVVTAHRARSNDDRLALSA